MSRAPTRRRQLDNGSGPPTTEPGKVRPTRCAIYTRKSTDEGLQQDYNSLDQQRDACEAYIRSQAGQGWICLPEHYDDGGFTGGNMDRPALKRLMDDIAAGRVDCVIVYKVDRLSRSLMDFTKMMDQFERQEVSFVSVTQHFNTANSMGRLTLNVLLSFAQFEREIISERTRDKMAAARRKGKWSGGTPPIGYDVVNSRLVINEFEADRVRDLFRMYLDLRSLLDVVREANQRGWVTKRWTTKQGVIRGGSSINKNNLYYMLRNVVYIGKVNYGGEIYEGEHPGIIEQELFDKVQKQLMRHAQSGGLGIRAKNGGVLSGLIRCHACNCSMTHTYSARKLKRYRYYVCLHAQTRGYEVCPCPSIPAEQIERFVVDQIRVIGRDPSLLAASVGEIALRANEDTHHLGQEAKLLASQIHAAYGELSQVAIHSDALDRVATIQSEIDKHQRRLVEIRKQQDGLSQSQIDPQDVERVFGRFDPLWEAMSPNDRGELLRLLIQRIDFDGKSGEIELLFHAGGIRTLVDQHQEGDVACQTL